MVVDWLRHNGLSREAVVAFTAHTSVPTAEEEHRRRKYLERVVELASGRGELRLLNACVPLLQGTASKHYGKRLHALFLAASLLGEKGVTQRIHSKDDRKIVRTVLAHALGHFQGVGSGHRDFGAFQFLHKELQKK